MFASMVCKLLLKYDRYDNMTDILDLNESKGKIKALNLSESWLNAEIPNSMMRIEHYKIYRQDRKLKKRRGGLCTYVHESLQVDALKYNNLNFNDESIEVMVLEIQQKPTKPMTLVTVYRPPQGNQSVFMDKL